MIHILVVQSVEDGVTRERHGILMENLEKRKYAVSFCYALHSEGDVVLEGLLDLLAAHPPTEEELGSKLRTAILKAEPHFTLLHTGFVFSRYPEVFYAVFRRLREEFPRVRFGYQERKGLKVDSEAFNNDTGTREMQKLFFERLALGL